MPQQQEEAGNKKNMSFWENEASVSHWAALAHTDHYNQDGAAFRDSTADN